MKDQAGLKRICIICLIAMLVMFIVHVQVLVMFNQRELTVQGKDSASIVYMEIDDRENATSRWLKRDYPLTEERTVDLYGQTIDGVLYNNSGDTVREWGLRINITGDCFINQAWNGEMEIHQYVGTSRETVQRFDLQDYKLEDMKLEYRYDGDLLIPLQPGDYVIYHPSTEESEMPVDKGEKIRIGMIFYYLNELDLSNYNVTIHFHRGFTQGWSFFVFIGLAALWLLSTVIYGTGIYIYRNAQRELEMRKSGLVSMSELYKVIYIINLPTGEITPVSAGAYLEDLRARCSSAKELLYKAVGEDAAEAYRDEAVEFVNTDTLGARLKDRSSIVCEFFGKHYGWCSIRFFAMDQVKGKEPENVIFTVQDINDDRTELKNITDRLERAESVSLANADFLSNVSGDLQEPVRELLSLDEQIMDESDPGKIREYAKDIHGLAERILLLINGMSDQARMESGKIKPAAEPYSLKRLVTDAFRAVRPEADSRRIRLEPEVAETIPNALLGDAGRLKEAIVSLMVSAVKNSWQGSVKLSVFGKVQGDTAHLLFSVRSVPEKEMPSDKLPKQKTSQAEPRLDLEIAGSLLDCMGSGLKTVQSSDDWQEVYFEIDQGITDPAPVGRITAEDTER